MRPAGIEPAACGLNALGNDQVDGNGDRLAGRDGIGEPDPWLGVPVLALQAKSRSEHRRFELGRLAKQPRIEGQVAVGGVGSNRDLRATGPQVDSLCAGEDHGVTVGRERCQCVEQYPPSGDVAGIEVSRQASPLARRLR